MSDLLEGHASAYRDISGLSLLTTVGFDARAYLDEYPDLASTGSPLRAALHYLNHGSSEGRIARYAMSLPQALQVLEATSIVPARKRSLARSFALSRLCGLMPHAEHVGELGQLITRSETFRPLLVFGDSHAAFYKSTLMLTEGDWLPITLEYPAASARGLRNPVSRSNTGPNILNFLDRHAALVAASSAVLVFHFGQVDIEFLIHFRRAQQQEEVFELDRYEAFAAETVDRYFDFLDAVRGMVGESAPILVSGVFPPTLQDGNLFKDKMVNEFVAWANELEGQETIEMLARLEMPDLDARTALHRRFNTALRLRSEAEGFGFVEAFDEVLGEDGRVGPEFIRAGNGQDHHLDVGTLELGVIASLMSDRVARAAGAAAASGAGPAS